MRNREQKCVMRIVKETVKYIRIEQFGTYIFR